MITIFLQMNSTGRYIIDSKRRWSIYKITEFNIKLIAIVIKIDAAKKNRIINVLECFQYTRNTKNEMWNIAINQIRSYSLHWPSFEEVRTAKKLQYTTLIRVFFFKKKLVSFFVCLFVYVITGKMCFPYS